jgi:nucleoside-diphosphate-sugar epimerase
MEKESVISTFNDMSHPLYSNNYSHLKYLSHALTKSMATELNVDYIWGRITNSYGPGENSKRLICSTMKTIANGQTPSFSSGNQLYDFIHISDLVKAFIAIGRKGISNSDYVLGSGSPRLLKEYLNIVNQLCAPHMSFNYGSEPDISKKLSLNDYDTSKLKRDTGFVCSTSFENGIRETYKYYINSFKTNL